MTEERGSIFLFHGEDNYSVSKKTNFWIKEFKNKHGGDINIDIIEAKSLNTKEFGTNLQAVPFLGEKRLVIVKNYLKKGKADEQKKVAELIQKTPDHCILVFTEIEPPDKRLTLYKRLTKIAKVEEFKPLSPAQLTQWIITQARERNGNIDNTTANFLSTHVGPNLWQLSSEIDKLIHAAISTPDKRITRELIEQLVKASLSSSIFKLTDAIAARNKTLSLNVFKVLIDSGEDLMMVFYMIVRHFRILAQAQYLTERGERPDSIAKILKQHPFVAQTASRQSRNFTAEKIRDIYAALLEIDRSFKTGRIRITTENQTELLLEIEKLIIQTCSKN